MCPFVRRRDIDNCIDTAGEMVEDAGQTIYSG